MTRFIVALIKLVESLIMTFCPEIVLAPEIITNLNGVVSIVIDTFNRVNFLVPLTDAFAILTLDIMVRVLLCSVFVGNWVVRRIFDVIP